MFKSPMSVFPSLLTLPATSHVQCISQFLLGTHMGTPQQVPKLQTPRRKADTCYKSFVCTQKPQCGYIFHLVKIPPPWKEFRFLIECPVARLGNEVFLWQQCYEAVKLEQLWGLFRLEARIRVGLSKAISTLPQMKHQYSLRSESLRKFYQMLQFVDVPHGIFNQ